MSEDRWKGLTAFVKNPAGAALLAFMAAGLLTLLLTGKLTWGQLWGHGASEPIEAFSAQEMRDIVRKEVAPLRAGIEALAEAESDRTKAKVFQAMLVAERRNAETNP